MIFKAIEFSTKAHTGLYRKGTKIPYITHPLNVAQILIEYECPESVVTAGILHDTLEDTQATVDDIRDAFGYEVADLVNAVSEPNKYYTWENRKAHTIKHLKTASPEVLMISLADKMDNIKKIREDYEKIGNKVWERFNRPKEKQKWYYEALADVFSMRLNDPKTAFLVNHFRSEVNLVFK
jgi:Guanosine polyphosphate pyrophosphohydrolases/synthetases